MGASMKSLVNSELWEQWLKLPKPLPGGVYVSDILVQKLSTW